MFGQGILTNTENWKNSQLLSKWQIPSFCRSYCFKIIYLLVSEPVLDPAAALFQEQVPVVVDPPPERERPPLVETELRVPVQALTERKPRNSLMHCRQYRPHFSKSPIDLKQNGTQKKTPFSGTVFNTPSD